MRIGIRGAFMGMAALTVLLVSVSDASAAPTIANTSVSQVTSTSVLFEADVNPNGVSTTYRFEYGPEDCSTHVCEKVLGEAPIAGTSPIRVKVPLAGLEEATVYHYRAVAVGGGTTRGPDRIFATYSSPFAGLPDQRAYEQASPVNKDAGDAVGKQQLVKSSLDGNAISFGSTFGMPNAEGAQALPSFLAQRGEGEEGWSTRGLLPPISTGERARVKGWLPDYSIAFSESTLLGNPRATGFFAQSTEDGTVTQIGPYRPGAEYFYAGASADGSTVLFEANKALPTVEGDPAPDGDVNLYAWDRESEELHLAARMNDGDAPTAGAFAGNYDWVLGSSGQHLREGGAFRSYYLQDTHAIDEAGDVLFAAAGTGQLYLRRNPTMPQSPLGVDGNCEDPDLACTLHVSASKRTKADPAGEQPAIFRGASADGSTVFFTSKEMLTDDANTGPEQPEARISREGSDANPATREDDFIPKHAIGVATDSEYVYWVDPTLQAIGRAKLDGDPESVEPAFIAIPEGECEPKPEEKVTIPAEPRYLTVDSEYIYWTNTGRRNELGEPLDDGGTIGRAKLDGDPESVEPAFICGASNPQGIGVSALYVYWTNAAKQETVKRWISRADLNGTEPELEFFKTPGNTRTPYGLAVHGNFVYFVLDDEDNNLGSIRRITLEGEEEAFLFIGEAGLRGVAADSEHVYWVAQKEGALGRADLKLSLGSLVSKFIPTSGTMLGLTADPEAHLLWAVNGEAPTNPGTDLYRYQPATETLTDVTPDSAQENGAEVQGVLGVSDDGKRVYLAANGDLAGEGPGAVGNCKGLIQSSAGKCGLYLWEEGSAMRRVTTLDVSGNHPDSLDWVGTPVEALNTGSYAPRPAFLSEGGGELLFRSQEKLSAYDNEGVPELYLYREADESISCVSCRPSGEEAGVGPDLGSLLYPGKLKPANAIASVASHILSTGGGRVFFETAEALAPEDTNGAKACLPSNTSGQLACTDVYEWEAPGTGSCEEGKPPFNPLNGGCLYLISTGKSPYPSLLGDASADGTSVFFFTRDRLVGQDQDDLQDVYAARVGGGLASQNVVPPVPCGSVEACHGPEQPELAESTPATPSFVGPETPKAKPKPKKTAKHHRKRHHKKHKHKRRARAERGRGR